MNVLVACEFSGVVREAFRKRGHNAWSCDLLPARDRSKYHIQIDAREAIRVRKWDLLICHTECTYFCNSAVRWFTTIPKKPKPGVIYGPPRWKELEKAAELFNYLWHSDIPMVAMENPIPHCYAVELVGGYTQIIHPWQFGHGELKSTCLWLRGLKELTPTRIIPKHLRKPRVHHESAGMKYGLTRNQRRSVTYPGIADAMAVQWGGANSA